MPLPERADMAARARAHALQFDRMNVFDRLLDRVDKASPPGPADRPARRDWPCGEHAGTGRPLRPGSSRSAGRCCSRLQRRPQLVVPLVTIVLIAIGVLAPLPVGLAALALVLALRGLDRLPVLAGGRHRRADLRAVLAAARDLAVVRF